MRDLKRVWKRVKLGEVVERHVERVTNTERYSKFVGVDHLDQQDLRLHRHGAIGVDALPPTFRYAFQKGAVLVPTRRPRLRKCAVAPFDGLTGEKILVLKPVVGSELNPALIAHLLTTSRVQNWNIEKEIGSVTPHFRWVDMAECEIALPPPDEQVRLCEALLAVESVVASAQDLASAAENARAALVDNLVDLAFKAGGDQELNELIEGGRPITYGILKPGTGFPDGVPVVKVRDYPDGVIETKNLLLTDPAIDREYKRSRLRTGDLLISIRGTVGRLAFVAAELNGANITQDTARLSISDRFNATFVRVVLGSSRLRRQIHSHTTGLAVQGLNIGALRKLRLPQISRAEQDVLADRVLLAQSAAQDALMRLDQVRSVKVALLHMLDTEVP